MIRRSATLILLISLLTLIGAVTVLAQPEKERPPDGGAPRDFNLPTTETSKLSNDLTVTLIPYGTVPKSSIQLVVRVGNIDETADQLWLADLVGEFLKEGTASLNGADLARKAAGMGGELYVAVGTDQTTIGLSVLSEFTPQAVSLLAEIMASPAFPESELDRLKRNMARDISIQKTPPQAIALERFRKVLYGDQRYGTLFPTDEMLAGYGLESVKSFFSAHFGPAAATLYVAGVYDKEEVQKAVTAGFEKWTSSVAEGGSEQEGKVNKGVFMVDRPGAAQSSLIIGLPVVDPSHPDYLALSVTNALLGGSFGSRITSNIRENKGYTYSPYSSVASRLGDAYWAQNADVSTAVTGAAIKEILFEIDRLANEPPSVEELKSIQNYLAGIFVLQNSSRGGIIGITAFVRLHGLAEDYLSTYVEKVHAVTPERVSELVRKYIRGNDLSIVVVGDKATVAKQLEPFGKVSE